MKGTCLRSGFHLNFTWLFALVASESSLSMSVPSNPQLSPSSFFLRVHVHLLLNLQIIRTEIHTSAHNIPLPHNATWGNTQYHTHKLQSLSKICLEYFCVSIVVGIDIQYIPPWCPDPLGWHRDKPEDKRFYATCCIEAELLYVKSLDNGLVEVTDVVYITKSENGIKSYKKRTW